MKVWYCESHQELGDEHGCWVARQPMQADVPHCRLVPMRLIPDNLLTLDRAELVVALDLLYEPNPDEQGRNTTPVRYPLSVIGAAAEKLLALHDALDGETP